MRGLRSTIALLAVLIGLSAYIYFVTSKRPESGTEEARERVFASLDSDKIDEIKVKAESGASTTVKKDGGIWQVTAPLSAKADASEASAITSNLGALEVTRVVDENPGDLAEYGLDSPRVEIEFKASGDKNYGEYHRLSLGGKSPTGGDVFARRDADKRVILIAGYVEPIFNRSTFDLRDKTLLALERSTLDRISVSAGGTALELAKDASDWKLTRPIAALADSVVVDSLMGLVQAAAIKSIVTEQVTPADLKQYGFDKPQGTVTLHAGNASSSLVIGGSASGGDVYVRDPSKPLIATTDTALLKDLQKGAQEYRRKEVFALRGYSTDRLEFTRDGQTIAYEKVKAEGQPDKWRRVSPNAGEPNAMNMEKLLAGLEGLRAASFADSATPGLDKPALSVYAKFDDGKKEERVSFARAGSDVYAAVPGQPGPVTIASSAFDDLNKALDLVAK